MVTKSIRLTEEEADEVAGYLQLVGGTVAALLKEAALRGFREMRVSRGVLAYVEGAPVAEAARIAGLPRAPFLQALIERGISVLRDAGDVQAELDALLAAEAATGQRVRS